MCKWQWLPSAEKQQNVDIGLMESSIDQGGHPSHGHSDLIQAYYGLEIQHETGRYDESKIT